MALTDRVFKFLAPFNQPNSSHTLGVFRLAFSAHLLLIISEVFRYRELIFDAVPGVSLQVFPALIYLFIWFVSVLMLFAGFFTRFAAIVNYLFVVVTTSLFMNAHVGTFNDDLLRIGSFLCIFMPVSRSFSIDAVIKDLRMQEIQPRVTSGINALLMLFLSLGLLYFPSGLTKTYSPMWVHGLGLWIPCNIPHNKWNDLPNLIVNQEYFMYAIDALVIIWEVLFIFILFIPGWRKWIVIPGLIFHLGIALLFPFPAICTGPYPFYLLFLPDKFWAWLADKISSKQKREVPYNPAFRAERVLSNLLITFDFRRKFNLTPVQQSTRLLTADHMLDCLSTYVVYGGITRWINFLRMRRPISYLYYSIIPSAPVQSQPGLMRYSVRQTVFIYFCLCCTAMQGGISLYHVYSHYHASAEKRMAYMLKRKAGYDLSMKPTNLMRTFLGINSRGLFLDHANTGQKTTYAIVKVDKYGTEEWLPMVDQRGYVNHEMNMNIAWAKVTFNLLGFSTAPADSLGVKKITKWWMLKHHINDPQIKFRVYGKTYTYPSHFEMDYYKKLEAQPWFTEGEGLWNNGEFSYKRIRQDTIR